MKTGQLKYSGPDRNDSQITSPVKILDEGQLTCCGLVFSTLVCYITPLIKRPSSNPARTTLTSPLSTRVVFILPHSPHPPAVPLLFDYCSRGARRFWSPIPLVPLDFVLDGDTDNDGARAIASLPKKTRSHRIYISIALPPHLFIEPCHGEAQAAMMDQGNAFHLEVDGGAQSIEVFRALGKQHKWMQSLGVGGVSSSRMNHGMKWLTSLVQMLACVSANWTAWSMSEACACVKGRSRRVWHHRSRFSPIDRHDAERMRNISRKSLAEFTVGL